MCVSGRKAAALKILVSKRPLRLRDLVEEEHAGIAKNDGGDEYDYPLEV